MDLLDRFLAQVGSIPSVWMPFALTLAILLFAAWRVMQWHYRGRIETLEHRIGLRDDTIKHLENRQGATAAPAAPVAAINEAAPETEPVIEVRPPERPVLPAGARDGRTFVPEGVDLPYLRDLYRQHTAVQADKLAATYLGKWIGFAGFVGDVSRYNDTMTIAIKDAPPGTFHIESICTTWARFKQDHDRVEMLRTGDKVTIIGRLHNITAYDINLEDAELVKAE